MPVRVEFLRQAADDLLGYGASGNLTLFLKKLVRLEEVGKAAGQPLGGSLTGYRKIVVGDRNWRIIFTVDPAETVATVLVIGDRDDAACYDEATRRVRALGASKPAAVSLAAVMLELSESRKAEKRSRRRHGRSGQER
jgi:mRNA interferase RelE/StbE